MNARRVSSVVAVVLPLLMPSPALADFDFDSWGSDALEAVEKLGQEIFEPKQDEQTAPADPAAEPGGPSQAGRDQPQAAPQAAPEAAPPAQAQPKQAQPKQEAPAAPSYDRAQVAEVQELLNRMGYDAGPVDGLMGGRTRQAIEAFQQSQGMTRTGQPDDAVLAALREAAPAVAQLPTEPDPEAAEPQPATTAPEAAQTMDAAPDDAPLIAPALPGASAVTSDAAPTGGGASAASTLLAGAAPSQDYAALAARYGLHLAGGLPVIGGGRSVLTDEETAAAARFLDFVELGLDPGRIERGAICWAGNHLPKSEWEAYLDKYARNWLGGDEFEKERTKEAFLSDHASGLKAKAVSLPLEVLVVDEMTLPDYSSEIGGFDLRFEDLNSRNLNFDTLASYRGAPVPRAPCSRDGFAFSPPAVTLPEVWSMDAPTAETILNRLNDRHIYIAFAYRFRPMPLAKVQDAYRPSERITVWSEITAVGLYEDADLERPIASIPLITGAQPVLLSGLAAEGPFPATAEIDEVTLALVMLRDHGDVLDPEAWQSLIQSQAQADEAYYQRSSKRDTGGSIYTNVSKTYDAHYVPFFPKNFGLGYNGELTDEQFALFKEWALLRARNLPHELLLRVGMRKHGSKPVVLSLPVAEEDDRSGLVAALVEKGYSVDQILRPDMNPIGVNDRFDHRYLAGGGKSRLPAIVLPNIATSYVPAFSEDDVQQIFGDQGGSRLVEIVVNTGGSALVPIDGKSEALVLQGAPKRLMVYDNRGDQVVLERGYEVAALDPNRLDVATLPISPPGGAPLLTAEMVDLLVVKHAPEAVSEEQYRQMLRARWEYEAAVPPADGEPSWGRFFVPGKARPTDEQFAGLLQRFESWTAERAAALPDRFTMHYRLTRLDDGKPVSAIAPYNPSEDDGSRNAGVARNCRSEANPYPALVPACDYLDSVLATTPSILPFGYGLTQAGPRLSCATVLPDHRDPYCKARAAQYEELGGGKVEPGFRDVFVLDKEMFFDGGEGALDALRSGTPNLVLEIGVTGVGIADGPLPRPFDEARRRYDAYRKALGLREDGYTRPEAPPARTTFVFDTTLHAATLVADKTYEPRATFELRPARTVDLDALEVPDATGLPDAPFGPDVVGVRLGMTFDEADAVIRSHMTVGQVLVRDRARDTAALTGNFERFSSSRIYLAADSSEFIILYDEPPSAPGIVLALTRQINLPHGAMTPAAAVGQLRQKYGQEDRADQNGWFGWGAGLREQTNFDTVSHQCMPASTNRGTQDWTGENGAAAEWSTGSPYSVPNMTLYSTPTGRVCGPVLAMTFEGSQNAQAQTDRLVLHLVEPNLYLRHYDNSRQLVESGQVMLGEEAGGPELKL